MGIDPVSYQRTLGDELRKVRKQRGWTRRELQQRLQRQQCDISLQTLATYELGTRQCSVARLAELCLALQQQPHELLERVHRRMFAQEPTDRIRVNLASVASDDQPELLPFRRWAVDRMSESAGTANREIALDLQALEHLAELCGLETVELVRKLNKLA